MPKNINITYNIGSDHKEIVKKSVQSKSLTSEVQAIKRQGPEWFKMTTLAHINFKRRHITHYYQINKYTSVSIITKRR